MAASTPTPGQIEPELDLENAYNSAIHMGTKWTTMALSGAAICSFAANGEHQISLTVGDQLLIKESSSGFVLTS